MVEAEKVPFIIPISLDEIFLAMVGSGRAVGGVLTDYIEIPPGFAVQYILPVPQNTKQGELVIVPVEYTAQPDPDYQIAGKFQVDNLILVDDEAMVAALYTDPMNFLREYSLSLHAKQYLIATFTNTSLTDYAKVSFRSVFVTMLKSDYDKLIKAYIERIKDWLLGQEG